MTKRHNDTKVVRADSLPVADKPTSSRRSVRLNTIESKLVARYKFFSNVEQLQCGEVFTGKVLDLSKGGLQLIGPIPNNHWLISLGSGSIFIGCHLILDSHHLKSLTRVRWARPNSNGTTNFGLEFIKMEDDQRETLNRWLLRQQIKTFRHQRRDEMLKAGEI